MGIDHSRLPPAESRGFELTEDGGDLLIQIHHNFEALRASSLWASAVVTACPGPYRQIRVDCRHLVILDSTLIAGLVRLADHYGAGGGQVALDQASARIQRSVEQLRLTELIGFV